MVAAASSAASMPHDTSGAPAPGCASADHTRRTSSPTPAALDVTESHAVTGVGAPSYTSGAQKWNGAAATL